MNLGTNHFSIREHTACPTPMNKVLFERPRELRRRDGATYTCTDGVCIWYGYKVLETEEEVSSETDEMSTIIALRNGILLRPGKPPIAVVNRMRTSRDMKKIICGGSSKTYALPSTTAIINRFAFYGNKVASVRLNEGLKILEEHCFKISGIRKLSFPSSVKSIGESVFERCDHLKYVDLSSARGLKSIGEGAFSSCEALKQVSLNDGLETIGEYCFEEGHLERVDIPGSVKHIGQFAFQKNTLTQVRFLGIAESEPYDRHSSDSTESSYSENKQQLVIRERAFTKCRNLRQIVFDSGSAVEEIQQMAFQYSGLESFVAPLSLKRIGALAFGECRNLKTFELNEDIQEVGWLCLLGAGTETLRLPPHIKMTREQLGLDQDPKVLRLPRGLEKVGAEWFSGSDIEKVLIPNTVRKLGDSAFADCKQLHEVVFELGSQLETISTLCFESCSLEEITIPRSVQFIGNFAFSDCFNIRSLAFEEGSKLVHVGTGAFEDIWQNLDEVNFPRTARIERDEKIKPINSEDVSMRSYTGSEEQ